MRARTDSIRGIQAIERIEPSTAGRRGFYGYGVVDGRATRETFLFATARGEAAAKAKCAAWAKANKITPLKGVVRIDQPEKNSHGWQGRVSVDGEMTSKFFSNSANGGTSQAWLRCATWVRAESLRRGKLIVENAQVFTVARSSTGYVGVFQQALDGRVGIRIFVNRKAASRMMPEGTTFAQAAKARLKWYREATKDLPVPKSVKKATKTAKKSTKTAKTTKKAATTVAKRAKTAKKSASKRKSAK